MAVELGSAYLSIGASTDGFAKDVNRALGNAEKGAGRAGKRGGGALGKGLATGLKVVGGAVAGVTALVGGLALKGGISRALNIEDAQAKLTGLGHDTKSVETIMDSALASVKGTAFGLGDAATVAASAVAAGIEPGDELTRTLSLVGDAATIAGTSMGDMGTIFNKVAGTGKVQGEVIQQLGERGIPILQLLADEMGVSAEEVSKLASQGKVDFETFQNAMEKGMGGAALKSGDTLRGSLANLQAALGRLGEKAFLPLMPVIAGFVTALTTAADDIGPLVTTLGEALAPVLKTVLDALVPVATTIATTLVGALTTLAPAFATVAETLLPVFVGVLDTLAPIIGQAAELVADLAAQLGPILGDAISTMLPLILNLASSIFPQVIDVLATLVPVVAEVAEALFPALITAVQTLLPALEPIIPALLQLVEAVIPLLPPFAELVTSLLPPLTELLLAVAEPLLDLLVPALGLLADYLTNIGVPALKTWWDFLGQVLGGVIDFVTGVIKWFTDFRDAIVLLLTEGTDAVAKMPESIRAPFENAGTWLYEAGKAIVDGLVNGIKANFQASIDAVKNLAGNITGWFKSTLGIASPSKVFKGYGANIVQGLVRGIRGNADAAKRAASDLAKLAREAYERGDKSQGKRLRGLVDDANDLKAARRAAEKMNDTLTKQRDILKGLRAERAAMRDQVAGSVRGELDLTQGIGQPTTDSFGRQSAGKTTFASVAGVVKTMAAKAKTFALLLQRLPKAGIPAGLIQEIAGYGTEQGTQVARAILSGSKAQIKSLAADFSALETWSDKAGKYVSDATFNTAIAAQKGLIAGLEADSAELDKAAERLAKRLAKAVKKALKIKSPSRVFSDEIGAMLPAGIIAGIDEGQRALDARVAGMVPTPNAPTPRGMAGNSAGRTISDADIEALADAFARRPIAARAYLDNMEARKVTQVGIQEIRRTDPAVLR